jgi:hypothetical protein
VNLLLAANPQRQGYIMCHEPEAKTNRVRKGGMPIMRIEKRMPALFALFLAVMSGIPARLSVV